MPTKPRGEEWWLEVLSWGGITANAKHSYASLRNENADRIVVRWSIDKATADEWNAEDPEGAEIAPYEAGDMSERFNSSADAESVAVSLWFTLAKRGDYLRDWDGTIAEAGSS